VIPDEGAVPTITFETDDWCRTAGSPDNESATGRRDDQATAWTLSQFKPPSVTCVDGLLTCFPWRERHSGTHSRSILPAPVGCTEPRPASHLSEHASDLERFGPGGERTPSFGSVARQRALIRPTHVAHLAPPRVPCAQACSYIRNPMHSQPGHVLNEVCSYMHSLMELRPAVLLRNNGGSSYAAFSIVTWKPRASSCRTCRRAARSAWRLSK